MPWWHMAVLFLVIVPATAEDWLPYIKTRDRWHIYEASRQLSNDTLNMGLTTMRFKQDRGEEVA